MNGDAYDLRHDTYQSTTLPPLNVDKAKHPELEQAFHSPRPSSFVRAFDTASHSTRSGIMTVRRPNDVLRILLRVISRVFYGLIPSFIETRLRHDSPKPAKLQPTAYLDGMRGLAAFCVFICHMSYQVFWITFGFGQGEPGENAWPIQLPIVKLFYSGPPMVAIFFVISGYALSLKPLKQMRARQYDGLMVTLSSATFRRSFRLFLPCFASTFLVGVLAQLNLFEITAKFSQDTYFLRAHLESHCWTAPSPYIQFWHWANEMFDFVHPWDWFIFGGSVDYDRHLWTIPTEFRSSMVLFLTHLMVARMRPGVRLLSLLLLIYWAIHWDRWEMILFWSGLILAELHLISAAHGEGSAGAMPPSSAVGAGTPHMYFNAGHKTQWHPRYFRPLAMLSGRRPNPRASRYFWWANFICGLYLASYPDDAGHLTPGYRFLTRFIPPYYSEKHRFWQSIAAVQIIWAVNNADFLKKYFTTPVVQYLGKISFSLYLMHGPVIHTFGYLIMPKIWALTGTDTRWRFELGFFCSACCIIPAVIWAADVFTRVVDDKAVRFARWLEEKCIVH
ncbi:MAG: hypothetical protein M1831_000778 [Alyxoria varia]|nr:MAG: hypothetical protein M1831_000778 [Alyxoria varia]